MSVHVGVRFPAGKACFVVAFWANQSVIYYQLVGNVSLFEKISESAEQTCNTDPPNLGSVIFCN